MIVINALVIIAILLGIYFYVLEKVDINLNPAKMEGKEGDAANSGYLESITGASLDEQLIEVLLMISSCLKAGRNLDQAFELVAVSTPPPICNEFRTLVQERRLGVPMVEALTNLSNRVPSQDLRLAVNATIFQQETGGNLEDLYTQILLTISERKKIMGKIVAGTAHARLSGNMVATIPVILAFILAYMQPDYLQPMLRNPYGQIALLIAATATVIGVIFINRITTSILPDAEDAIISKNDSTYNGKNKYKVLRLIVKPFSLLMSALPPNLTNKLKNETRFLLNASGKSTEFDVDEYIGLMAFSMVVFAILLLLLVGPSSMGIWAWIVLIALLPIGFRIPRFYLAHLIRKRQKNIEFELPYVIDLLSLAIESGLDLTGGIAKVVEKSRNTDIVVEFKMFLADIKVGKSMEEALADMAERVKVLSFFSFVSSLIQAQRLGADIGPTLRAQAEQMRYQRLILAEERVNKLPVKLLVPLVFFVFPSISVLLIGPAMIQIQTKFPQPEQSEMTSQGKDIGVLKNDNSDVNNKVQSVQSYNQVSPVEQPKVQTTFVTPNAPEVKKVSQPAMQAPVTVTIEERHQEQKIETMPVVPNVTPAPITITEPVAAPSNPTPIKVTEPVIVPSNPAPETTIEPVKINETNNNQVVPSESSAVSVEEKISPIKVESEATLPTSTNENSSQNDRIESEKVVPLPSIIGINSGKEESSITGISFSVEKTKPVEEEIISSPENDKSSLPIETPQSNNESNAVSVDVNIGE